MDKGDGAKAPSFPPDSAAAYYARGPVRFPDAAEVVSTSDPVHRPNHYARFKREPVEFIMENDLPFWCGSVIKYVLRYDAKDGIQDLRKARRYLDMKIKQLEGATDFAA